MFAGEVSRVAESAFLVLYTYFIISKWSVLAPGHEEQIRRIGKDTTEKEAAVCTSSLNS